MVLLTFKNKHLVVMFKKTFYKHSLQKCLTENIY